MTVAGMSAVCFDGSASSARAVELASLPGFIQNHEESQLLLFFGWSDTKDVSTLSAIPQTIEAINKSRVAQFTLNYKIEATRAGSAAAETTLQASSAVSPVPSSSTPAPGDKPKPVAKKPGDLSKTEVVTAARQEKVDRSPEEFAHELVKFVEKRSEHHNIDNLFLGVLNEMHGKLVAFVFVAK
jgi:hypothetical protein